MKKMDFHVHVTDESANVEESIRYFADLCQRNQLNGICIHAAEYSSSGLHPDCNERALAVSRADSSWYAFAGLHHACDFVEQTKEYMDRGFRGIKLLEGKPSLYRYYGYGFDHPRFEPFFAYAEEQKIPLLIHNNDPILHWDIHRISPSALKKGWYYDPSFPPQEHFFAVLEQILARHPALHAAIAHFGFYSDQIERAEGLMEKYPSLMMDMTPALIIYDELSERAEQARNFLLKYHDRILYGTDVSNRIEGSVRALNDRKTAVMKAFFEDAGHSEIEGHSVQGMALPEDMLEKIYFHNAMRFIRAEENRRLP